MPGELPDGIAFPVRTQEELDQLEDRLADQQTASAIVSSCIIFCLSITVA